MQLLKDPHFSLYLRNDRLLLHRISFRKFRFSVLRYIQSHNVRKQYIYPYHEPLPGWNRLNHVLESHGLQDFPVKSGKQSVTGSFRLFCCMLSSHLDVSLRFLLTDSF